MTSQRQQQNLDSPMPETKLRGVSIGPPRIEVIVFCHNHEDYIVEALEGIFIQKVDAVVNIRIHDDASTDKSLLKIQEKIAHSPFPCEVESSKTNRYSTGSSFKFDFLAASQSDFVAILDGDDYWVAADKLQGQLEFMLENPDVALCHTAFRSHGASGTETEFFPPNRFNRPKVPGHSLSETNFIGTLTVMLRRADIPEVLPAGFDRLRGVDDYPLWSLITEGHWIGFINRITSVYRLHPGQNFQNQDALVKQQQVLDALIWIANAVSPNSYSYWVEGVRKASRALDSAENPQPRWPRLRFTRMLGSFKSLTRRRKAVVRGMQDR